MIEAPMDVLGGDVVAAASDSMLHAFDVQLRTGKANVPDINLDAVGRGLSEEARNCIGAERGFEGEVFALGDRPSQELHALVPCGAVGVGLRKGRVSHLQCARRFVGIVVIGA